MATLKMKPKGNKANDKGKKPAPFQKGKPNPFQKKKK